MMGYSRLPTLVSPSLGTIGGENRVGKGRGGEGKDKSGSTHCGGYMIKEERMKLILIFPGTIK